MPVDISTDDISAGSRPGKTPGKESFLARMSRIPARGVISLVRLYQLLLSPLVGGQCRFHPSCSQYFIQAVEKYGVLSGTGRGIWRILRCQPFHPGGYDPP